MEGSIKIPMGGEDTVSIDGEWLSEIRDGKTVLTKKEKHYRYTDVYLNIQKCRICEGSLATGQPVLKSSEMCPSCHYADSRANGWAMENIAKGLVKVEVSL